MPVTYILKIRKIASSVFGYFMFTFRGVSSVSYIKKYPCNGPALLVLTAIPLFNAVSGMIQHHYSLF